MPLLDHTDLAAICDLSVPEERVRRYLERLDGPRPMTPALERMFINDVVRYSVNNGISVNAWLDMGVPARVLEAAHLL